uniref:Minor capsid protein L2 n=1 Tax=Human papillomavirus type 213 TaxID=2060137 RepID=A0A2H4V8I5_9PAPI|nr:L2 protein [Human papillomavirus type 213]
MAHSRRKRASVGDLYKSCAQGGDCLQDVKNKVEGTTLADRLLQIFGSLVYFGGLGIGTGKGTGGSTGYRPITGSASRPTDIITPTNPRPIPLEPLGASDVSTIIDASSPSIVPLSEGGVPEIPNISSGTPNISVSADVTTTVDIATPTTSVSGDTPAVISTTDEGTAVLDVQSHTFTPKGTQITISPDIPVLPTHTDSTLNIFVDAHFSGDTIGAEYIPLQEVNTPEQFTIQEPTYTTSTPIERFGRSFTKAKDLYHRFTKQIPAHTLEAVIRPSRHVTFEFDNPAFSDDVSLEFIHDVNTVSAAPDHDFADIQTLGRPILAATESGAVRASRLGHRASMKTRSGLVIGEKVHFYHDISTIATPESFELSTFNQTSGESVIHNAQAESVFIDHPDIIYSEDDLLDVPEDFSNSQLLLTDTTTDGTTYTIPTIPPGAPIKVFVVDAGVGLQVIHPVYPVDPITPSSIPIHPLSFTVQGESFVFDPDIFRKRRKRKLSY